MPEPHGAGQESGSRARMIKVVTADELVMERFRLMERIGSGGMGTVYRAFDERLQRAVAVKEIETADAARVLREAQAAARLNHPSIVTLYELGEHDGSAILISELVPGQTLAALHRGGALCDREVAEIATDVCDALAHAHSRGVIHRDVKPHNVIVRDDQDGGLRAKLMDFGIASLTGSPTLTADGEVVGTLAYMSPEQAEGLLAGTESDVYSLALTAYECWAGVNPVAGHSPAETARRIGAGAPSLAASRPDLPPQLLEAIDASLEPDPACRPTVDELGGCLEADLDELDSYRALTPLGSSAEPDPDRRISTGRIAGLCALAATLLAVAGPLGAPGLALVLAVLCVPSLIVGAPVAGLAPVVAPIAGVLGLGSAAAGLGAVGDSPFARAVLGIGAWTWLVVGSLVFGAGPDLGIAADAPAGWTADAGLAADSLLGPLMSLDSLLGAAIFAAASVTLGWLLTARHAAISLLGAMLWAAAVDGSLSLVGDGSLGHHPVGVVCAAALAVALEFGLLRPGPRTGRAPGRLAPLGT